MCARFTLTLPDQAIVAAALGVDAADFAGYAPRYNIAPTEDHWIVVARYEERELLKARWGLVKGPDDDPRQAARQINARAETLDTRPAFRDAFRERRCVVPADGFYEWVGPKKERRPLRFHRPDGGLVLMAGLFEPRWRAKPGEAVATFTIVTTDANEMMAPVHDRMPVILAPERVDEWIDPRHPNPAELKQLLVAPPDDWLVATPASRRMNRSGVDGDPSLLVDEDAPPSEQGSLDL